MAPLLVVALAGAGLFAGAALVARGLRRASAAHRSLVWGATLVAGALLPVGVLVAPVWTLPMLPALPATSVALEEVTPVARESEAEAEPDADATATSPGAVPDRGGADFRSISIEPGTAELETVPGAPAPDHPAGTALATTRAWTPPSAPSVVAIWAAGAALLLTPMLVGVARMLWIAARARTVADDAVAVRLDAAARTMGLRRSPRLLVSEAVPIPVVWQAVRPAILVPPAFLEWSPERQAIVLLHELAHVRRQDGRLQLLGWLTLSIHWFDPLAWLALAHWRRERERACDDAVLLTGVRPSRYASDLVAIGANAGRGALVHSLAPSLARRHALSGRVRAILDPELGRRSPQRSTQVTVSLITLILTLSLAGFRPAAAPQAPAPTPAEPAAATAPTPAAVLAVGEFPAPAPASAAPPSFAPPSATPVLEALPAAAALQSSVPDLDDLVSMRIHGVTPEFIEEMNGLLGVRLTVSQLVQMRIHGVDADEVRTMSADLGDLDVEQLVSMRIHGVDSDFIAGMREQLGDLDVEQLVQMRIHGASPEWVREMSDELGAELRQREVVQMRIHGVSPKLVRDLREAGYEDLTVEELVRIRIHGMDKVMLRRRGGER